MKRTPAHNKLLHWIFTQFHSVKTSELNRKCYKGSCCRSFCFNEALTRGERGS